MADLQPRVLLAVRDPDLAREIGPYLGRLDLAVETAATPGELRELVELVRPDLVVLEERFDPGPGLARELVHARRCPKSALLLLLGEDPAPELQALLAEELVDYLPRSLLGARVSGVVRRLLRVQRADAEAQRAELRLSRVRRMARLASWELSLENDRLRYDAELPELYGHRGPAGHDLVPALLARVHESDRGRVERAWRGRAPHLLEYRVLADGPGAPSRVIRQEAELVQDEANGEVRLLGTVQDITPLKEAERKAARLAYFDSLTGLPNRAFLREHLLRVLASARRNGSRLAVMGIDLDLFKRINDTMGHAAGDALLQEVARRLSGAVRDGDSVVQVGLGTLDLVRRSKTGDAVVRMGGDEFVIVLHQLREPEDAALVARRIAERVAQGIDINGTEVFVGCSIGIAVYPENGETPESLLKHADAAMYHAKERGRNNFQFFSQEVNARALRRLALENGLRHALPRNELELHYQPKLELESGRIVGVEALLRWRTQEGENISPAEFIPVAEDAGLIVSIGRWVLRTACAQARRWLEQGLELPVAVNVSARQLREADFEATVRETLRETRLPAPLLELEITEGVVMQDTAASIEILQHLRALGVRTALDDFGTGYSSLSYLNRLPLDMLKVDRSFVRNLPADESAAAITAAIVALSRTLSLEIIAEGVETTAQRDFLLAEGCTKGQGYLYSPPLPAGELESRFLRQGRISTSYSTSASSSAVTRSVVRPATSPTRT